MNHFVVIPAIIIKINKSTEILTHGKHGDIYMMHWKGRAMEKNTIFIEHYVST